MGCHASTMSFAEAVPELSENTDGCMSVEQCIGGAVSVRSMTFEWTDTICPLAEMTPHFAGPTARSPDRLPLGHRYWIGPGAKPMGDQKKFLPPEGSATLSLAGIGQVSFHGPVGRVCVLKKLVPDNTILKSSTSPWQILEVDDPMSPLERQSLKERATISFDRACAAFVYSDRGAMRWIARGTHSKLTPTNPLFNSDGATCRASLGLLTVYDAATENVVAVFSGSMKGPKNVQISKNSDIVGLLCFALAACFWWDDDKVAQINFGQGLSLISLGAV